MTLRVGNSKVTFSDEGVILSENKIYINAAKYVATSYIVAFTGNGYIYPIGGLTKLDALGIDLVIKKNVTTISFSSGFSGNVNVNATSHSVSKGQIIRIVDASGKYDGMFLVLNIIDADNFLISNLDGSKVTYSGAGDPSAQFTRETIIKFNYPGFYFIKWNAWGSSDATDVFEFYASYNEVDDVVKFDPSIKVEETLIDKKFIVGYSTLIKVTKEAYLSIVAKQKNATVSNLTFEQINLNIQHIGN